MQIKNKLVFFLKYWLPFIIWALVIFLFSNSPTIKTSDFYFWDFILKKTAHFSEYGIFSTLLYRALINSNVNKKSAMFVSVAISLIYAITDEIHQSYIPGRTPAVRDVLIDLTGAYVFLYIIVLNINKLPTFIKKTYSSLDII